MVIRLTVAPVLSMMLMVPPGVGEPGVRAVPNFRSTPTRTTAVSRITKRVVPLVLARISPLAFHHQPSNGDPANRCAGDPAEPLPDEIVAVTDSPPKIVHDPMEKNPLLNVAAPVTESDPPQLMLAEVVTLVTEIAEGRNELFSVPLEMLEAFSDVMDPPGPKKPEVAPMVVPTMAPYVPLTEKFPPTTKVPSVLIVPFAER